jgi:hypothetical protein
MTHIMAGRKKRLAEEAGLSGQPAGEKTTKEPTSAPATSASENASRTAPKLGRVDATMTDTMLDPVRRVSKKSASKKAIMADPVLGPDLIAKFQAGWYDLLNDPLRSSALRDNHVSSMRAIYDDPVRGPALRAKISGTKQATGNKRTGTRWRHAMRDPLTAAYRRDVIAMPTGALKTFAEKGLSHIDDIDKTGSIDQKRKCLKDVICKTFLPVLYSHQFPSQNGVRYPGDGGPDPQVETDYESDEGLNHRLDTSVPNAIVPTPTPRPKAEPTWKVIRMTAEGQQAYLVHRKELRAREKANRTEDEELIDLAKRKIYSTRATKRKWLGKSGAVSHNAGTRISTVNLGNLGAALGK